MSVLDSYLPLAGTAENAEMFGLSPERVVFLAGMNRMDYVHP